MPENATEKLKSIVLSLLTHMGFDAEVFERQEEGRTVFNIKARDAQLLIGKLGANLDALQHIVRIIYRKVTNEDPSRPGGPASPAKRGERAEADECVHANVRMRIYYKKSLSLLTGIFV